MLMFFSNNKKVFIEKEVKLVCIPIIHKNCTAAELN